MICGFKVGFAQNKFGGFCISNDSRILFNIHKFPVYI